MEILNLKWREKVSSWSGRFWRYMFSSFHSVVLWSLWIGNKLSCFRSFTYGIWQYMCL